MPVTGDGTNGVVARIGAWKLTAQEGHLAGVDSAFDTAARDGRHLDRTLEGILDTFDSEANRHTGRAETATEIGRELGTSAQIIAGLPMPTEQ
jgi:hypothetical protein